MGIVNDSSLAIGNLSENALAIDVASGLPREAIIAKYELSPLQLGSILEKPRVKEMVEGRRSSIQDAVVRLHHRMAMQSDEILQGIVDSANDEGCPHRFHNARYVIDKLLPNVSYEVSESHHTVDVEVVGAFNDGVKDLEKFIARGSVEDGFVITEDDPHLHQGKDVMEARDKSLMGLGSDD